ADRLAVEGTGRLGRGHVALAFVEHAHVAAQGQGRNHVFGAVAAAAQPQRLAEAHREAQHVDAEAPCDPVMAEFVEGHQHAEADDHPPDRSEETVHAGTPEATRRLAWARAPASAASRASSDAAGAPGTV